MNKKLKIAIIFFGLSRVAFGQFSMENYLGNAISDSELDYINSIQGFLKETDFRSPFLREVEFRARVQNFGDGFEDYRLRFSPLNPLERRANKQYKEALSNQFNIEYQLKLEEVLLNRYSYLIEHHQLSSRNKSLQESAEVYQKILEIYKQNPEKLSLRDYISADKALIEVMLKLESVSTKLRKIENSIQLTYEYSGSIEWDKQAIISIEDILKWYMASPSNDPNSNLYLKNERQKGIVATTEFNVEKKEDFRNLGYIQAEYREDLSNNFVDNLGLQLAFRLPIINPDKPDLERERLELLEESKKLEQKQFEMENYLKEAYINLDQLFKQYEIISKKLLNYEEQYKVYAFSEDVLDTFIDIHDFKIELEAYKQNLEADIRNSYISLLSFSGQLSSPPYINYLSASKTTYEMIESD